MGDSTDDKLPERLGVHVEKQMHMTIIHHPLLTIILRLLNAVVFNSSLRDSLLCTCCMSS